MNKIQLNENNINDTVKRCSESLSILGSFVVLPTETVYGLACKWNDEQARQNIYTSKGRSENKPFQMLAADLQMVKDHGGIVSKLTQKIADNFCPGPITIIIPSTDGKKIGFRIPQYKFIWNLIDACSSPLAATSANLAGKSPALSIDSAISELHLKPNVIIDAGKISSYSQSSTVLEVDGESLKILREGPISLKDIDSILN